jgi:dienelactone hydrolase
MTKGPKMTRSILPVLMLFAAAGQAEAAVQTETIEYEYDGTKLKGELAWDDRHEGARPGVLVVHEWWGLNDYARDRAKQLAQLGYVAFAVDMYGEGKTTEHPAEAGKWAQQVRANQQEWLGRAQAGLNVLKKQEGVDTARLGAIGYCFGGSTALQLAFSGADLKGIASFHGALPVPSDEQVKRTKARLLVCHGAQDSFIPEETVQKFRAALDKGQADYVMIYYAGARHSFTVPTANEHGIEGIRYDKKADERSWRHMREFFEACFAD